MMAGTETGRYQRGYALPLALRLFLGIALLIVFAIVAAVVLTQVQGRRIAGHAVGKALDTSAGVQREFAQRRLEQVQMAARLIAADADFVKYIGDAGSSETLPGLGDAGAPDTGSMRDLLGERSREFALDVAVLLDASGNVLASSDEAEAFERSMAGDPLVAAALRETAPFSGYWRQGDRLLQAAVVPLAQRQDLVGFLLVALDVDDALASSIAQVAGADVAYWLPGEGGPRLVASSLERPAAEELQRAVASAGIAAKGDRPLALAGEDWVARFAPTAAAAEPGLGTVGVLASSDQITADYRALLNGVVLAGLASLVIALLLSLLLARRVLKPVGEMAEAAEAAAAGDYGRRIDSGDSGELGRLARAFDSLLSDLREKSDMEGYVGHLARFLPEPAAEAATEVPQSVSAAEPPRRQTLAVLGIEFRQMLGAADAALPAADAAAVVERAQALLQSVASAQGAQVSPAGAARWWLAFVGADRLRDATTAWASVLHECARSGIVKPAGALADGELLCTSVGDDAARVRLVLGPATAQIDRLLADSLPGQLLLARGAGDALAANLSAGALGAAQGAYSGKRYYALAASALPAPVAAQTTRVRPVEARRGSDRLASGALLGGRYRIISELGAGGMGVVYKAHDLELDDIVALKMLRPGVLVDTVQLERLKSEIKLARRITHPNVLRTFDFGEADGRSWISMEYVRGLTLRYLLGETRRVPYSAALRIARQLSAGLAAAHAVGVLHRDIKPENLILEANGNAKLMDFGIARPVRRDGQGHTEPGTFVGTPNYCAPEQLLGDDVDERGDLYACGVVMSEMFCGGLPYPGGSTMEIYQAQMRNEPVRPSELWPDMPPELEAVILRCLRCNRDERYASAQDLHLALTALRA
ncbi:MAG: serine/threonine protein kinase [Lysobacteraceae bacterium]|nr:MAG: serine/threonine protein kinase [Xanthomonadaceae bacterium]